MALTQEAHGSLSTRLLALIAEYAAASDRRGAEAKITALLAEIPVAESGAVDAVSLDDAQRMVAEIERLGQETDALRATNAALAQQLADTQKELDEATAALEEATKPKIDQD